MAKQADGMYLFPEIFATTHKMTDEQFGALVRAGRAYQTDGTMYDGDDIAVDIAFQFLANQIDRQNEASTKKTEAAKKRWSKKEECKAMQNDAEGCTTMHGGTDLIQNDAPIHSFPIHSIPIHKENKADEPPASTKQTKKAFGEFGWVKLTDDEYNRLINDLGEAEVKRCIAYVDESAQSTGNKNKWRDWNLVVRKCHRQGWGLDRSAQYKRNQQQSGPRELDSDEVAAIMRMMGDDGVGAGRA